MNLIEVLTLVSMTLITLSNVTTGAQDDVVQVQKG